MEVIDRLGRTHDADLLSAIDPELDTLGGITSEESEGWVTFEVPRDAHLRALRADVGLSFEPRKGLWRLE